MNVRSLGWTGAVIGCLVLAGCSGMASSPGPNASLEGTAWLLHELPGRSLVEPGNVTLQFAGDRATGSDGCNRFSGGFTADAKALQFTQLVGTQMACAEAVMAQARSVTEALGATRSYRNEGGRLALLAADGRTLAVFLPQSQEIAGTAWDVTGINNGKGAVASLVADSKVTLAFDAAGRASGSAGCNRFTAGYTVSPGQLKIAPAAATRMMCPAPGVMEQEQAFLQALQKVATLRMEGDRLELRDAEGAMMVSARRAASTP